MTFANAEKYFFITLCCKYRNYFVISKEKGKIFNTAFPFEQQASLLQEKSLKVGRRSSICQEKVPKIVYVFLGEIG